MPSYSISQIGANIRREHSLQRPSSEIEYDERSYHKYIVNHHFAFAFDRFCNFIDDNFWLSSTAARYLLHFNPKTQKRTA